MYNGSDQTFVPTTDLVLEPYRFFHVLSQDKVGYTFAPNFFLAAAAKSLESQPEGAAGIDLSNLSLIMCGGEANRTTTLEATDKILQQCGAPPRSIKAAYGLSETCSACYYNLESPDYDARNGNTFASVGKHLPSVLEMKLVTSEDQATPDEGLIFLRGDIIFKGYYNNPEATKACMTEDGWMNTGDVGRLDVEGNLHLLGRAKEVLVLNGNNYSSFEIEYVLETANIPGLEISYTAAFSTWDQERNSEAVIILFNPTEAAIGAKNMRATLQAIDKCVFTVCAQKPIHVVPLPKALMPKSTIGKLSRAKLKQSFESGEFDDYLVEGGRSSLRLGHGTMINGASLDDLSPLQREIAHIYAGIVGVKPEELIGQDALLSSGINSIGFLRLKKALEKGLKIHQEIPMPLLLRCHSLADLEHELTLLGTVSQQYEPIVPLVTTGTQQSLFLLHPGAGEFLCWIGLLKYLPDRPIYALRAKGLHPGEGTFEGLQDLLDTYYAAIRRVQPTGPYALLGYCFGGLLCFELAKMLEAAGSSAVFCGGIDNPPSLKVTMGQVRYRTLMFDVLPIVTDMTEEESKAFAEETADLTDEEFYEALFTKFSPEFIENMDLTVPRLQAFGRVEDCMRLIVDKYVPEGMVSTSDIFCAEPMPHFANGASSEVWKRDYLGQWKRFVRDENVAFHDVPGTHISLIKEPLIVDFQRTLNEALERRGI
jgi:thioesterase domain-containing protein